MRIVFWDIDGTLLTTRRAGIIAWQRAVDEVLHDARDVMQMKTAGLTDTEIAATIVRTAHGTESAPHAERLLRRYEWHLPACLPLRSGTVLPGVKALLEHLQTVPDVRSILLTGNTRKGATAKLSHYGLAHFFENGAFADNCATRTEVARLARQMFEQSGSEPHTLFLVGDTPHDIHCGRSIDAVTIAVATGEYSETELAAHRPSIVLPRLPEPSGFLQLLYHLKQHAA
jgi:phosphoglycolate phosphatase-like HAD superfamily hydrolase